MSNEEQHNLTNSELVENMPLVCSDELAAVELFEQLRWGKTPACVHCGSVDVYKMVDGATGQRNKRYLWRCHDCKKQFTVRIGTVYEETRIDLRHWAYAFWRASTSKKGVAALEIKRQCQISYKSALFLMNRIRFAMAPLNPEAEKLSGIVECDETFVGGKPRPHSNARRKKTPVFAAVERDGRIRRRVIADVSGKTLKGAIRDLVAKDSRIMTDEFASYYGIGYEYDGGHQWVTHSDREYAYKDIHVNTAESSFALLKRSIMGIYHSVSREHLHRYLWQADFLWNLRKANDGERTTAAIKAAEGKRLVYRAPTA